MMRHVLLAGALAAMLSGAQTFREQVAATTGPAWIAYTVPMAPGHHRMCGDGWQQRKVMLEGAREMTVLFRVERGAVQKIRVASEDCEIDSGDLQLVRVSVKPAESVAILAGYADQDSALMALSLQAEPAATSTLVKIARENGAAKVRGKALFWLASSAQNKVAQVEILRAAEQDPEVEVKRSAVFALSRLPNGEGVPKLIELAAGNRNVEVRKQAMFWLGQSKDDRAIAFFEKVLTR